MWEQSANNVLAIDLTDKDSTFLDGVANQCEDTVKAVEKLRYVHANEHIISSLNNRYEDIKNPQPEMKEEIHLNKNRVLSKTDTSDNNKRKRQISANVAHEDSCNAVKCFKVKLLIFL